MREILFRGKSTDTGAWVYGYYCGPFGDFDEHEICDIADHTCSRVDVDPETVGQYTGLTDKNGKRIFEGDIVRYGFLYDYNCYLESLDYPEDYEGCDFSNDIKITTVKWYGEGGYPAFDLENHDFESNGLSYMEADDDYVIEVVGNIHDNPELIGGKEDGT